MGWHPDIGNRSFSTPQIKLGLKAQAKVDRSLLQSKSVEQRAEHIAEKIVQNYRTAGYLSASVSRQKVSDNEYVLNIEEGTICQLKAFDIVGVDKKMADQLIAFLTGMQRKQNEQWIPSIDGKEMQVRAWDRMDLPEWRDPDPNEQGAAYGTYIKEHSLASLQWRVADFFTSVGYASPKFQLELLVAPSGVEQTLRVVVEDLGPELTVTDFVIEGEDRISSEQWMEQLGLSKNMQWTHRQAMKIQAALFAKGVFRVHDVVWIHTLHNPNEVRVRIRMLRSEFPIDQWKNCAEIADYVQRWNEDHSIAVDLTVSGSDEDSTRTLAQFLLVEGKALCKVKNVLEDVTGIKFRIQGATDLNAEEGNGFTPRSVIPRLARRASFPPEL